MMTLSEIEDSVQYAKDLAKAERELAIEHWVYISFEIQKEPLNPNIPLHQIDLPRYMLDRWMWIINWRQAKLICKYPRENIRVFYSYYDKRTGLDTGFRSLLSCLAASKAQVTRVKRIIDGYIDYERHNNLFFNEETDEKLMKGRMKLKQKEENVEKMLVKLKEEVEQHKKTKNGTE